MGNESETCNGIMALRSGGGYNYKLHVDFTQLAERSQKLFCAPAVDLVRLQEDRALRWRQEYPASAPIRRAGLGQDRPLADPNAAPGGRCEERE